jgi:sec-independent protein translocase protein TatA
MGFSGIGIWQLLIILAIVILIFGTKRLPGAAKDLGSAITNFREGMKRDNGEAAKIEDGKDDDAK